MKRAANVAPGDADTQVDRAMLLSSFGWFGESREALRAAATAGASLIRCRLVEAMIAQQQNDLARARKLLAEVRATEPDNLEALRQLAGLAVKGNHAAEAVPLLNRLAADFGDTNSLVALARIQLDRADTAGRSEAHATLDRLLTLVPSSSRGRLLKARALRLDGRLEEARKLLATLEREPPKLNGLDFEWSQLYKALGRDEDANAALSKHRANVAEQEATHRAALVLMAHPGKAEAHRDMGLWCGKRRLFGRAIVELEKALQLDPKLKDARELLGTARDEAQRAAFRGDDG